MKNLIFYSLLIIMFSCGKNVQDEAFNNIKESSIPPYDTIAKDSFSAGAISVDIARKIKMSSKQCQDSLVEVRKKLQEEKLLKEEKDKADKKLTEAEDAEKGKKEKEKKPAETSVSENVQNP